jgi:hypothetical protein
LHEGLCELLDECLVADPEQRIADASELQRRARGLRLCIEVAEDD